MKAILFSSEMVRAILEGRKTQTRRVIKPQPPAWEWNSSKWSDDCVNVSLSDGRDYWVKSPYGAPGDLLWVREGFAHDPHEHCDEWNCGLPSHIYYRAEETNNSFDAVRHWKWRPSIHMPRWASRITLRVTDVRVERVQEISMKDCLREGVKTVMGNMLDGSHLVYAFRDLWNAINAKRGYGWDANPWVWVVEFETAEDAPDA